MPRHKKSFKKKQVARKTVLREIPKITLSSCPCVPNITLFPLNSYNPSRKPFPELLV